MTVPTLIGTRLGTHTGEPSLILGPSLGTSTLLWEPAAELLAPHFNLLAWDLPGHGGSPAAHEPFSVAELADGVIGLAGEAGVGAFYYAGVSLGGQVGLELALRHPDRVLKLAVICSAAKIGDATAWKERAAAVRAHGTPAMVDGSAERWFAPGFIAQQPEGARRLLQALSSDTDDESYALCCEALGASDVRDRLREIATPTIAIYGEHDVVVGATEAELIAQHVQQGAARKIAGAAHLAPVERPEAVTAVIIDFFRKGQRDER
jgi:3-oxoadipate enol-lactonase